MSGKASTSADAPVRLLDRQTWTRFAGAVRAVATSEIGPTVRWHFAGLIALMLAINGLDVVNSYVGRDFMTAIERRSRAEFITMALLFALSTVVAVFFRFLEERLGLVWRVVSRIRVLSSSNIAASAGDVVRRVIGAYLEPNETFRDLEGLLDQDPTDPLREFSNACREELRGERLP